MGGKHVFVGSDHSGRSLRRRIPSLVSAVALATFGILAYGAGPAFAATVPDAPTIGTATAGVASVSVTFTAPVNDGGSAITGYTATCTSSNGGAAAATSGASSPIVVSPLTNGKTYTCSVTATNAIGTSVASGVSNAVVPATVPDAPTIGTATPGAGSISETFTAPANNGGSAITGYTVTCASSDVGVTGTASGPVSPIVVSGLTNGSTYTCSAVATNSVGSGSGSASSNAVVPTSVPGAPTINTVTSSVSAVSVDFAPPADNGGSPITNYTVTCLSSDGGAAGVATGAASPIVVSPLTNGSTYTCTVFATNAFGDGPPSAGSAAAVPATVPGAPTIGVATGGFEAVSVTFTPPADDGGSAITSYTAVCISSTGGVTGSTSGPSSPISVTPLTDGATYTCSVSATNSAGTSEASGNSNSATAAITAPGAPTIGTATSADGAIDVAFTPPANTGGSDITTYDATCVSSNGGATGTASDSGSPIHVDTLTNGKTYTCTVTATNAVGAGPPSGASNAVVPAGAPDAPTIGTATGGVASASVAFTASPSNEGSPITGYTATCVTGDGTGAIGSASAPNAAHPIVVSPLTNGKDYTCTVTATNAVGTSAASDPSNDVIPATVPRPPTIGTATSAVGSVVVNFVASTSDGGSPITGYTARCVPTNGGAVQTTTGVAAQNHALLVLAVAGKIYTCSVTANNAVGHSGASAASNPVSSATPPGAPTIGTATSANTAISVAFSPPASNGGAAISSYTASCTSSNGGAAGSATAGTSPITVGSLTNGKTYTCTVKATNSAGTGPASGASNAVVPAPTVPGAPTIGTATAGGASISVTFTAPASNGSPISSYTASCVSSDGGVAGSGSGAASPVTVNGLSNGNTYTCVVTATNGVGTGPASGASNAVVPAAVVPGAPTIGTATRGNTSASVTFTAPASDGGSPITSYTASCASTNGGVAGSATGASSPIVVGSLTNGKSYTCTVKATNGVGNGPASAASNAVVPATVPGAPTIGTATVGNGTAIVPFVAPANNGGAAVTSYTARCVSSNGGAAGSASAAASPITVPALTNAKTYTCAVTATNAIGQGGASAASEAVVVGAPNAPTGITATAGTGQATVSWTAPVNNNGSAVTGYVITAYIGFFPVAGMTFNSTATTQTFTGLVAGKSYKFQVAAVNARGIGVHSMSSNAVVPS